MWTPGGHFQPPSPAPMSLLPGLRTQKGDKAPPTTPVIWLPAASSPAVRQVALRGLVRCRQQAGGRAAAAPTLRQVGTGCPLPVHRSAPNELSLSLSLPWPRLQAAPPCALWASGLRT